MIGSLRIDDFIHDDDVGTAESLTTHVLVAGDDSKQNVLKSSSEFLVTFFCAILLLLSLGYLFGYLRRQPKVDFCFLKSKSSFFLKLETQE